MQAQQLKLGTTPTVIQKSALLELESTKQGLLLTRISDTLSAPLNTALDGTIIYFTPDKSLRVRANGIWQKLGSGVGLNDYIQNLSSGTQTANFSINGNGSIGGTLGLPSLASGSVLFMNGTNVAQNNTNFFWDIANSRLGVGTNTPNNKLEVAGTTAATGTSGLRLTGLGTATPAAATTKVLSVNATGDVIVTNNSSGTVTSVGLSLPGIFTVSGSPVTTTGTLTGALATQTPNFVFAGPASGATAAAPTFRALVAADLPAGSANYIQNISSGTQAAANYSISGNGAMGGNGTIGGTLTLNSLTAGSVLFVNSAKAVAQNNAQFFWDNTNNRLGIGTTTPGNDLEVGGSTTFTSGLRLTGLGTATPTTATTKVLSVDANGDVIVTNNASVTNWLLGGNSNATASNFLGTTNAIDMVLKYNNNELFRGTRGQTAAESGGVDFSGNTLSLFNGATRFNGHPVIIRANGNDVLAFEDATGTPKWHWNLLGNGLNFVETNVKDYRLFLENGGNVGIGTPTPSALLDVEGDFQLGTSGTVLNNIIKTSVTLSPGNLANNGSTAVTATVTGATVNATVIVNPRANLAAGYIISTTRVSAANTIRVGFINLSGAAVNANGTFDVTIIQ